MNETCGTCKFWKMDPIDPNNLLAPRQGECRHSPPAPLGIPTHQGLQVMLVYPKLPPQFHACGQHVNGSKPTPAPEG